MRSILIFFSTIIGGVVLHVTLCNLLGIVGKDLWMTITLFASFTIAGILSWQVFRNRSPAIEYSTEEALAQQGLLEVQEFTATRSFTVEEFEDEGAHCFLELTDGRVLYLNDQYLYEVMYVDPPKFPCGRFRIKRHKTERYVVAFEPLSPYQAPEAEYPSYTDADVKADAIPADGDIISKSFGELEYHFANRTDTHP